MESYEYATMAAFEDFYWWYRGLHGAIADLKHGAKESASFALVVSNSNGTGRATAAVGHLRGA